VGKENKIIKSSSSKTIRELISSIFYHRHFPSPHLAPLIDEMMI